MNRPSVRYVTCLLAACAALCAASRSRADAYSVVQLLREGGCGGTLPAAKPLEPNLSLTRTAALWAAGMPLRAALVRSGYSGRYASGLHVTGPDRSMIALIRRSGCNGIASRLLHDIGVYRLGSEAWVVVASPFADVPAVAPPDLSSQSMAGSQTPQHAFGSPAPTSLAQTPARALAMAPAQEFEPKSRPLSVSRALQLVNEARARGARCGGRYFPPAPALQLSSVLAGVARGHALDMAEHGYFEHTDLRGESPADRVRAVGYRERLVGENIAYGTASIDETVQGWLDSPEHCENIMDPRFAEMGIAEAAGRTSRRGLYWVQVLAEPGTPPARSQRN